MPIQVVRGIPAAGAQACALTIGNFDGVHRGHQALLARVVAQAQRRSLVPAVLTFEPHPREFFSPAAAPPRISNVRDKIDALAACGIRRVHVQHFDRGFAGLPPEDFISRALVNGCAARWLIVGDDFRFGAGRRGDVAMLQRHAARGDFEVETAETVLDGDERISSSAVRDALLRGDLPRAHALLGRNYAVSGRVMHGAKLGRTIGFPTLNLRIPHRRPAAHGIFAVRVQGLGPAPLPGVASIGIRPTIDDSGRWLLEVHLFDFAQQVYGRLVRVEFVARLRDEEKYASLDELSAAIRNDAARAREALAKAPLEPLEP